MLPKRAAFKLVINEFIIPEISYFHLFSLGKENSSHNWDGETVVLGNGKRGSQSSGRPKGRSGSLAHHERNSSEDVPSVTYPPREHQVNLQIKNPIHWKHDSYFFLCCDNISPSIPLLGIQVFLSFCLYWFKQALKQWGWCCLFSERLTKGVCLHNYQNIIWTNLYPDDNINNMNKINLFLGL